MSDSYIVEEDVFSRLSQNQLIQLTDDDKVGAVNLNHVARAISEASSLVSGYVASRYSLPIVPVPMLLKTITLSITTYNLYLRRQRVPDDVRQTYEDGIKQLEGIAKGLISLGVDPPPAGSPASQGELLTNESDWSRDKLSGF